MTQDANPALSASASTVVYQVITLNIVAGNSPSGDRIAITLRSRDGARISWSTGQEFSGSGGMQLRSLGSAAIPISTFSIDGEMLTLQLAPSDSGGSTPLTLSLFLAASQDIREFTLSLSSDARSSVNAALSMSQPTQLGSSPTIFDWSPY